MKLSKAAKLKSVPKGDILESSVGEAVSQPLFFPELHDLSSIKISITDLGHGRMNPHIRLAQYLNALSFSELGGQAAAPQSALCDDATGSNLEISECVDCDRHMGSRMHGLSTTVILNVLILPAC